MGAVPGELTVKACSPFVSCRHCDSRLIIFSSSAGLIGLATYLELLNIRMCILQQLHAGSLTRKKDDAAVG